jgi:ribosomal protein S18 acetylase RimI-like enzyme
MPNDIAVRVLGPGDGAALDRVADGVFDGPVDARWWAEFRADARHHLAVALDGDVVVGMASGVRYVHPDKPPELFVNEVGVADAHQGRGIGGRVLRALLDHGRALGCVQAWVLTSPDNAPAVRLYAGAGGRPDDQPTVLYAFDLAPGAPR